MPLLVVVPALYREFTHGEEQQHGFPGGVPVAHTKRAAERIGLTPTGDRLVSDLQKLDELLQSGALTPEEYAAKRRLLGT